MAIPKVIHQVWLGDAPIPEKFRRFQQTWKDLHPTWEYVLWTDAEVVTMPLRNTRIQHEGRSWAEKGDALRVEILFRHGGLYVDMDYECIQPHDDLLKDHEAVFALEEPRPILATAWIACAQHTPLMGAVIEGQNKVWPYIMEHQIPEPMAIGPRYLTGVVYDWINSKLADPCILDRPIACSTQWNKPIPNVYDPRAYAIHHFEASWKK